VVLAVHRNGERVDCKIGDIVLKAGDVLLLEAHPSFAERYQNSGEFFLMSEVDDSRPRRHDRAWIALAILGLTVVVVAFENVTRVSVFNGALVAAGLMGLTGCVSAAQARRAIDWGTLIAIGSALGIGRAMETTGLASFVGAQMLAVFSNGGALGVLCGVYLMTLLFTEVATNNAAAAIAFPVALDVARRLDVSLMPFAVAIAIAASAGFATPLGYQTHLMVYGPGGYRFSDYFRMGVPMDLIVMAIALLLIPLAFPF
jgi:di/tricarboxylate transporter